jgi:uncharacterized coiled-coil protein SlyX
MTDIQKQIKEYLKDSIEDASPDKILGYMKKVEKNMDETHPEELSKEAKQAKLPKKAEDEVSIDDLQKIIADKDAIIDKLNKQIAELSKPSTDEIAKLNYAYPYMTKDAIGMLPPSVFEVMKQNAIKEGKFKDVQKSLAEENESLRAELDAIKEQQWLHSRDTLIKISKEANEPYTVDELEEKKEQWVKDGKKPLVEVSYLVDNLKRITPEIEEEFVPLGLPKAAETKDEFVFPDSTTRLSPKFKLGGVE